MLIKATGTLAASASRPPMLSRFYVVVYILIFVLALCLPFCQVAWVSTVAMVQTREDLDDDSSLES
jgi:hypothetical protein